MPNFPKSEHFLPPDTHKICVSEGKKRSFSGKFGVFCFFETPVLRFALLHYCLVVGFGNNRAFFHVFYSMSSLQNETKKHLARILLSEKVTTYFEGNQDYFLYFFHSKPCCLQCHQNKADIKNMYDKLDTSIFIKQPKLVHIPI